MNRPHDEPLSPEERALAERLSRLGPHDGPSPALDAKILAAAHAAVAASSPRRRRWLALSAVPGSVITGVGMAAALVLVVGVVWQMRPSGPTPKPAREEGGNMGYVSAEILRRPQVQVVPPPPPPPVAPARELRPALARRATPAAAAAPVPAPAADDTHYMDEAVATTHASAPTQETADAAAVAAAPAPPSPSAFSEAAESERFSAAAAGAERREAAAIRQQAQAKAQASQRKAMAVAKAPMAVLDEAEVAAAAVDEAPLAEAVAADAAPVASVPVSDDARLPPSQWLQRIRERRDAGDLDGARASLARFRQDHPRERVPRDLRKLATPIR